MEEPQRYDPTKLDGGNEVSITPRIDKRRIRRVGALDFDFFLPHQKIFLLVSELFLLPPSSYPKSSVREWSVVL